MKTSEQLRADISATERRRHNATLELHEEQRSDNEWIEQRRESARLDGHGMWTLIGVERIAHFEQEFELNQITKKLCDLRDQLHNAQVLELLQSIDSKL